MRDIAVSHGDSPYISCYPWELGVGFGVKYAQPVVGLSIVGNGVAFCGNTDIAVAHGSLAPRISAWPWIPGTGFGVKYANPATLPTGTGTKVAFCGNTDIAVSHVTSPRVSAYPWNPGVGFGVKYANPATLPTGNGNGVAFCGTTDIAVAHNTAPYISTYPWTPGGPAAFGVKRANPATAVTGTGNDVDFSADGASIAVAHAVAPYVSTYPWAAGFGAKYADPLSMIIGIEQKSVRFCGNTDIAIGSSTWFFDAYPWGPGFGVEYASPADIPACAFNGLDFRSPGIGNTEFAAAIGISPYVWAYQFTPGVGYISPHISNPASLPNGPGYGAAFMQVDYVISTGGSKVSNIAHKMVVAGLI